MPAAAWLGGAMTLMRGLTMRLRNFQRSVDALLNSAISSTTMTPRPGRAWMAARVSSDLMPSWLMTYTSNLVASSLWRFSRVPCTTANVMSKKLRKISSPHARSSVDKGDSTTM